MKYHEVINEEDHHLRERRSKLFDEDTAKKLEENRFGIALSGGGIRSATINLGILKTLNRFGILKQSDYLSTVSGGGYTGAYVQATLKNKKNYDELFKDTHITWMRSRGEYLFPGTGWFKVWNQFVFIVSYISSLLMSFVSPLIIVLLLTGVYMFIDETFKGGGSNYSDGLFWLFQKGGMVVLGIFVLHYLSNVFLNYKLTVSAWFSKLETLVLGVVLAGMIWFYFASIKEVSAPDLNTIIPYIGFGLLLGILGLFTNPNSTSFHRYYRKQLSDAYLNPKFTGEYQNILLKDMFDGNAEVENEAAYLAPYPLINTCLNLQSSNDENFKGTKASDYFLLSPLYCGAKLTGYVSTKETAGYQNMTLPAAVTISAAAVNPGMGNYSSKSMSIMTTLLNLRLGYWVGNPLKLRTSFPMVWWPLYFFYELLSKIGTDNHKVNVSDGGHIENLGVFELLRRKCRLIIAVDAGADPDFTFADLENLTIRARNELGMEIRFREGNVPEDILRPNPSHGYSLKRFAIADIYQLWDKVIKDGEKVIEHYENKKIGTFIYVKSSVTAPEGRPELSPDDGLKYGTYKYKIYHPDFPHESTADQFFDPIQWESYYQLGQYIGIDILGLDKLPIKKGSEITIDQLVGFYDEGTSVFTPKAAVEAEPKRKSAIPVAKKAKGSTPVKPLPSRTRGGVVVEEEAVSPVEEYEEKIVDKKVDYKM